MTKPSSTAGARVEFDLATGHRTKHQTVSGERPASSAAHKVPRATELLAVGYHFDRLAREGKVRDDTRRSRG